MKRVDVLGVGFDRVDLDGATAIILERYRRGERTFVITANPEFVMLARTDAELRGIAASADLVVPDGTGALVASRLLGDPLPGRAPGRVLVQRLAARAAALGASVFLLGAGPGVGERAAARLRERHPGLLVAGTYAGPSYPEHDGDAVARVAAAAPQILLVAFGMPAQERWIARNIERLPSVRVAIGVGGVFDQLAGDVSEPPGLVHAAGLEWLWRLARDPRRWRRQRVLPLFALLVLLERIRPPGAQSEAARPPGAQSEARSEEVEHLGRASGSPASEVGMRRRGRAPGPERGGLHPSRGDPPSEGRN